jgi:quinol monooxygenase YgiN
MPSEEIACMVFWTAKPGREEECNRLAKSLMESTHAKDKGCLDYVFLRQINNPRLFAFYERWENAAAMKTHIERLVGEYGPPAKNFVLPAALLEPFESETPMRVPLRIVE